MNLKQLHELGHFMFKDSSWTVHEYVFMNSSCTILEKCSWTLVHDVFMNSKFMNLSNFMNLAISCSRIVHELFMNKCSWTVHVPFLKIVHGLQFMYRSWKLFMNQSLTLVHELFMNSQVHELQFMNSKFMNLSNFLISIHELLMNCSRTIHEQFMIISLGLGRASLITTGGTTSSHRTLPNIGWPVQTSRTIHFNSKLHVYPSPDTLINPSTDRIHH